MGKRKAIGAAVVLLVLAVVLAELLAVVRWTYGAWDAKLSLLLQTVGAYGLVLGFMKMSKLLSGFSGVLEDMTSSNLFKFLSGNFVFLGIMASTVGLGLRSGRNPDSSMAMGALGQLLLVLSIPVLLLYFAFHIFVLMPLAYVAYLLASAIVEAVVNASGDVEVRSDPGPASGGEAQTIRLKEVIATDPIAFKSFLIGVPSVALSMVTRASGMFFGP